MIAVRWRNMPGGEELEHQRVAEAIDDQPAQPVGLGVDEPVGVGDRVELQHVAAERDRGRRSCGRRTRRRSPRRASVVRTRREMREWPL